jgi:hypothetical protein
MNYQKLTISITTVLILGAILSACNFPTSQARPNQTTQTAAAQAEVLASAVSMTLTTFPLESQTGQPVDTYTATPLAPQASSTLTATATPAVTTTPTISPTPVQDDPAVVFGTPTGKDTLDKGNGFGLTENYDDQHTHIQVSDGYLLMSNNATNGWRGWRVRPPSVKNGYIEATFTVDSCGSKDTYGLVFRAKDYESGTGYYYGITCAGQYSLVRWDDSGSNILIPLTTSDKILTGAGQTNRIGVLTKDNAFTLYANGKKIAEASDSSLTEGYYGPWISGSSGNLVFRMDVISYWIQP